MKDYKLVIGGRSVSLSQLENKIKTENKVMKDHFTKIHDVISKFGVVSNETFKENSCQKSDLKTPSSQASAYFTQKLISPSQIQVGDSQMNLGEELFKDTAEFNNKVFHLNGMGSSTKGKSSAKRKSCEGPIFFHNITNNGIKHNPPEPISFRQQSA